MRSTHYNYQDQRLNEPIGRFIRSPRVTEEAVRETDGDDIKSPSVRTKRPSKKLQVPRALSNT